MKNIYQKGDKSVKSIKYLGLFEGIGVFALAAKNIGLEISQFVEIDNFKRQILRKNFPNTPIWDDVKTYVPSNEIDIICGGFPCQDISCANTKGNGIDGKHSGLWHDMARIIEQAHPAYVVIENVPPTKSRNWVVPVKKFLRSQGYTIEQLNLSAAQFGGCHNRKRTFLVAYSIEKRCKINSRIDQCTQARVFTGVFTKENPSNFGSVSWRLPNGAILRRDDGVTAWMDRYFQREKPDLVERKRIEAIGDSIYYPCAEYAIKYCLSC